MRVLPTVATSVSLITLLITGCGQNVNPPNNVALKTDPQTRMTKDSSTSNKSTLTNQSRTAESTKSVQPQTLHQAATKKSQPKPTTKSTAKPGPNLAQWFTVDMKHKTMTVKLIAGYQGKNDGYNIDGYSAGKLTVFVPLNWHVTMKFHNVDHAPHSAAIVPYAKRTGGATSTVFVGASTAHGLQGIRPDASETFSFRPSKEGKFALVSTVSHDAMKGMWANFVVLPRNASGGMGT